jgi:sporulation protein YlmC with PRC-barrel domain
VEADVRIVRDVLDKKLIDAAASEIGRVDGVTLAVPDDGPPRLVSLEIGGEILAARVAHWLVRPTRWLANHLGPRRSRVVRIEWSHVKQMGRDLHVDLLAGDTEALAWEHWLVEHFIGRIPGSGP